MFFGTRESKYLFTCEAGSVDVTEHKDNKVAKLSLKWKWQQDDTDKRMIPPNRYNTSSHYELLNDEFAPRLFAYGRLSGGYSSTFTSSESNDDPSSSEVSSRSESV